MSRLLIIDGDSIPYACTSAAMYKNLPFESACGYVDNLMEDMFSQCKTVKYIAFVQGKGANFRNKVESSYKANRTNDARRGYYYDVKKYFINKYKVYKVYGVESDDACVILHQRFPGSILASVDKDLLQSPGIHYNFRKKEFVKVSDPGVIGKSGNKVISTGPMKLWYQMLVGDSTDNIAGVKGIGPKKALKALTGVSLKDAPAVVYELYKDCYKEQAANKYITTYDLVRIINKSRTMPTPKAILNNG